MSLWTYESRQTHTICPESDPGSATPLWPLISDRPPVAQEPKALQNSLGINIRMHDHKTFDLKARCSVHFHFCIFLPFSLLVSFIRCTGLCRRHLQNWSPCGPTLFTSPISAYSLSSVNSLWRVENHKVWLGIGYGSKGTERDRMEMLTTLSFFTASSHTCIPLDSSTSTKPRYCKTQQRKRKRHSDWIIERIPDYSKRNLSYNNLLLNKSTINGC